MREHLEHDFTVLSYGTHAALLGRRSQVFAVHDELGVVGPLAMPEGFVWAGLAHGDQVFAADRRGRLFVAESVAKARERLMQMNVISSGAARSGLVGTAAQAWDSAGEYIVAALESTLFVSKDGGATFRTSVPMPGLRIENVYARSDGVIVVMGETPAQRDLAAEVQRLLREQQKKGDRGAVTLDVPRQVAELRTLVSVDEGRHFTMPKFQPTAIYREGMWLTGEPVERTKRNTAGDTEWAPIPALSRDGRWIEGAEIPRRASWTEAVAWTPRSRGAPRRARATATDPPPPTGPDPAGTEHGAGQVVTLDELYGDQRPFDCASPACVRGVERVEIASARWEYGVLSDGECARGGSSACAPEQPLLRAPKIAIYDKVLDRVTVAEPPSDCDPIQISGARAAAVLVCRERSGTRRTKLYLGGARGEWKEETALDAPPEAIAPADVATDGTIVVATTCEPKVPCEAWVRTAQAPSNAVRWRHVLIPGAVAYRAAPHATALAIVPVGADRFDLVADTPFWGPPHETVLLRSAPLPGRLRQVSTEGSRLNLFLQLPNEGPDVRFTLGDDGSLSREAER